MARVNNLTDFLNDVATAIKQKLGDNTPIPASQFDVKIGEIETAGNYQTKSITLNTNGTYQLLPDTGYDALSSVDIVVSVPTRPLQTKLITENGLFGPDPGYDGFSQVTVDVPIPTPQLQAKEIQAVSNQTLNITADEGYDGLSLAKVIIAVPGGGGDDPAVNAVLWSILGYDQAVFNILKRVIPIEQSFVAVGGTDDELYGILENIYEGGNE